MSVVKNGGILVEYRMGTINDIEQLAQMRIKYLLEDYKSISDENIKKIQEQLPIYYGKHLNKDMFAYVADVNGTIVSTAYLALQEKPANPSFIKGKVGDVLSVYTEPSYRRQGIAKTVIHHLLQKAKELQLDYVELEATKDGYPLYKALGFEEVISHYKKMKYVVKGNE